MRKSRLSFTRSAFSGVFYCARFGWLERKSIYCDRPCLKTSTRVKRMPISLPRSVPFLSQDAQICVPPSPGILPSLHRAESGTGNNYFCSQSCGTRRRDHETNDCSFIIQRPTYSPRHFVIAAAGSTAKREGVT